MHSDLYQELSNSTKEFYNSLSRDMQIYQLQYRQAMLNRKLNLGLEVEQLVSVAYIVREIVQFVLELDRQFSKRMSDLLGKSINYTTKDNHYCLDMVKALNGLFSVLKVPGDLRTNQTDMAFRVFKKQIKFSGDMIYISMALDLISFVAVLILCYKYIRLKNQKENEYYTDYRHNNLVLRIYKPEFEYQAIGKVPIDKILDRGTFSQFYLWALIEL